MARILVVGCGCRGLALARELVASGHAVRGTTRRVAAAPKLADAGVEPFLADPDRVGSLRGALEAVAVVCWLMGSATGEPAAVHRLHTTRLRVFLAQCVDTTVRGFAYEAAGAVDPGLLAAGVREVDAAHRTWEIPVAVIRAVPTDQRAWVTAARVAVESLLAGERGPEHPVSDRLRREKDGTR